MALLESFFLNPLGLAALLSLVPLIIIYLIKNKPRRYNFPSVSFMMKAAKEKRFRSKLSKIIKDPLFFIQLLALVLLSVAIASPYINVTESEVVEDTVIILDASASMQTSYNGGTRFGAAVSAARQALTDSNTIILVGEFPEILVEHGSRHEAERLLAVTKPKDTETNLYDAVILADDFLEDNKGKVLILSDFIQTSNDKDVQTAITVLKSKGILVETRSMSGDARNIGIVDMKVKDDKTEVRLKNFYKESIDAQLVISGVSQNVKIGPGDSELFTVDTPKDVTEIKLLPNDDFNIDNTAYISSPQKGRIKTLYITNNQSLYLYTALTLLENLDITIAQPPLIENYNYDLFIVENVDKKKLFPGTISEIEKRISEGATFILVAQEDIAEIDFSNIIGSTQLIEKPSRFPVLRKESSITEGVLFGSATKVISADGDLTPIAFVEDSNVSKTVIGTKKHGQGNVVFYGLIDRDSTFKLELFYPVFWKRLIGLLVDIEDIKTLNLKTGEIVDLGSEKTIIRPDGEQANSKSLILDQAGVYIIDSAKFATNLLSEQESDVSGTFLSSELQDGRVQSEIDKVVPKNMLSYFALIALIIVLLEILYIKYRGDL